MTRLILALIFAMMLGIIISPLIVSYLSRIKASQSILGYVKEHEAKSGTATMGGLIFIIVGLATFLVFFSDNYIFATMCLLSFVGYGMLGFLDDFLKIHYRHNEGLKPYAKIIGQVLISLIFAIYVYYSPIIGSTILIPFYGQIDIGIWIIPFVVFVFLATTNSVNLCDGLDGLAGSVSSVFLFATIIIFSLFVSRNTLSAELVGNINNLNILSMGVLGGVLSFLCYNRHPAKIFMGDTGSLALGGYISAICVVTRFYLLIPICGIMFVVSSLSDIIQVLHFKRTKKRIFLMAPIHHHFQMKGHSEEAIVNAYVWVSILFSCIAMLLFFSK